MMSSRHGPYELGHSCATMSTTKGCELVKVNTTLKVLLVRILNCNSFK
jgi:hypothetical protein